MIFSILGLTVTGIRNPAARHLQKLSKWTLQTANTPYVPNCCQYCPTCRHVYSREDIQRLCGASGMKLESYEVRKGFRLHCVVRKEGNANEIL